MSTSIEAGVWAVSWSERLDFATLRKLLSVFSLIHRESPKQVTLHAWLSFAMLYLKKPQDFWNNEMIPEWRCLAILHSTKFD